MSVNTVDEDGKQGDIVCAVYHDEPEAGLCAAAPDLYRELRHLVLLLEPLEKDGRLDVPGLATLNGARAALARASGSEDAQ